MVITISPRYDEYSRESRATAVCECDHLVEGSALKVSIKDSRADDGGQCKQHKLRGYDDFGVKTFQCTVQKPDLENPCND